jgi:L-ascorbate metabolism protein UlaG (beta-lactamase superfamily)
VRCSRRVASWLAGAVISGFALASVSGETRGEPQMRPFPAFAVKEGSPYICVLYLDDWGADPAFAASDLSWSAATDSGLLVDLTGERHLVVRASTADWFGAAEIGVTACNPLGECVTQTLSVCVEGLPDPPTIEWIPDQVVARGRRFRSVELDPFGSDPDGRAWLAWSVQSGPHLRAEIRDGFLVVSPADGNWIGKDIVELTLLDPEGLSARRAVSFTVTEALCVTITSLGVEGFLIEAGDQKILIDALLRDALPRTDTERERLREASYPYDGATLVLASHRHYDHFSPGVTVEYLTRSPATVFASVSEAVDDMRLTAGYKPIADRVTGILFRDGERTEFDVGDIHVAAFHLHHVAKPEPNLAFLVEIDGVRILHLGDASAIDYSVEDLLRIFGGAPLRVDVLLASTGWLASPEGVSLVTTAVAPRFAIPMHLPGACPTFYQYRLGSETSVVKLCARGETWIVPARDSTDP